MTQQHVGRQAVVIGAGIGGLTAAGALAGLFDRVILLERDELPLKPAHRPGVPQGRQLHGLLVGGLHAFTAVFPDFRQDLAASGAVPSRLSLSLREELGGMVKPRRDHGHDGFMLSRPLLEHCMRAALARLQNVTISANARVIALLATADGERVTGVKYTTGRAGPGTAPETAEADLVVDASGRAVPTLSLLDTLNRPLPREVKIGIDLGYATGWFPIPKWIPREWQGLLIHPKPPRNSRAGALLSAEGDHWIASVFGRTAEEPAPANFAEFLSYARRLESQTLYEVLKHLEPIGEIARFAFSESVRRYYHAATMPDRLIVMGDGLCRFNPMYGQGMAVAACQSVLIRKLIAARAGTASPLDGLGRTFLVEAQDLIDGPWQMAAVPDFLYPDTRGERPEDLKDTLAFVAALRRLAARDAAIDKLMVEVWHMLKPPSALREPDVLKRVNAEMAAMVGV